VARVLVIEDDRAIALGLRLNLRREGHDVVLAHDGEGGFAEAQKPDVDLVILDVMLPGRNGYELLKELRRRAVQTPVLMLTAKGMEGDKILGLKLGADDFIAKPFDIYELEARVEAVLRRTTQTRISEPSPAPPDHIRVGELIIDRSRRRVTLGGEPIQLTPTEYRLVSALASRPDEILSRDDLATLVWGYQDASSGRTIDVHIRRLRVKLSAGPVPAPAIVAVRGFGYKMAVEDTANGAAA